MWQTKLGFSHNEEQLSFYLDHDYYNQWVSLQNQQSNNVGGADAHWRTHPRFAISAACLKNMGLISLIKH